MEQKLNVISGDFKPKTVKEEIASLVARLSEDDLNSQHDGIIIMIDGTKECILEFSNEMTVRDAAGLIGYANHLLLKANVEVSRQA